MKRLRPRAWMFAAALILALPLTAGADPLDVHLTDYEDWLDFEPGGGQILPAFEWSEGLEGLYPGEQDSFREPQLYVLDSLYSETGEELDHHPGLVMSWGDPSDTDEILGAWDLVLPEDPDLTNTCVTLTAWPRLGMTSISFMLQDVNGVMKGWLWPVGPGGLPPDQATTITVRSAGGAGQAGSTGYFDGGIDLTQVVSFQFAESGQAMGGIPLPSGLPGFVGQWNYWHDIMVLSCPACPSVVRPNNGFGNGGGDGMPGGSAGRGHGRFGPMGDVDR